MSHKNNLYSLVIFGLLGFIFIIGCSTTKPFNVNSIKMYDPDTSRIPEPDSKREYHYWDRIDYTTFYQIGKPLDLNWIPNETGKLLGVRSKKEADNVNVLDEVPNSSWYTNRHAHKRMTADELRTGPDSGAGPDTAGVWNITNGKLEGFGAGFFVEDAKGDRYLVKLDGPDFPELASSAEVISTKIFYAAGYFVPENYITWFDPDQLNLTDDAEVVEDGRVREMVEEDIESMLMGQKRTENGKFRALASKFVDGNPVGIWEFYGRRNDDPNDRVRHEHRRELRGLRIISSWLNDADRSAKNTLAVYTDEQYIKHYLLDMGSTLGANGANPHRPVHGKAYLIDPRYMIAAVPQLGFHQFSWDTVSTRFQYRETGYFESDLFNPGKWVPTHPNPAFEKMTLRDAFWGVKVVSSFSNEDIVAIVETGEISNPEAEKYLVETLIQRRDKIISHWSKKITLFSNFEVTESNSELLLKFEDISSNYAVLSKDKITYRFKINPATDINCEYFNAEPVLNINPDMCESSFIDNKTGMKIYHVLLSYHSESLKELPGVNLYIGIKNKNKPRIIGINRYN
jgi:hypothetical protein